MSKSQQRRLKIQMSLSERIRNDVIGIKRPADYWAEEVAQLEAELEDEKLRSDVYDKNFREAHNKNKQLEAELASRTETLDAIEDGKIAEYWRTCFYHQQDLQRELEAELAAHKENEGDECPLCQCEAENKRLESILEDLRKAND